MTFVLDARALRNLDSPLLDYARQLANEEQVSMKMCRPSRLGPGFWWTRAAEVSRMIHVNEYQKYPLEPAQLRCFSPIGLHFCSPIGCNAG